ncbi:universal stress protein [Chloroflexota bacterium]
MQRHAERYLHGIAKALEKKGIQVSTKVLLGDPAEEIVIYTQLRSVDLIAICNHGRSGISRWAHGSVVDRVFRSVNVPVLLVRAPGSKPGI